ncbi:uncharacterized protein DS421_20g694500 [Arachis hypogaea]|nr:uncharacterized protein DS421_20g694500 [Arachis hypogaea]
MGVARQPLGVTRWYKILERVKKAKYMKRATWCRRRGMPSTIPHLGVPLGSQAWHASVIQRTKKHCGMPLEFVAWHAKQRNQLFTKGRGTLDPGRATLVQLSIEAWTSIQQGRGTPDPGRAPLVQVSRGKEKWKKASACHLSSKAWHAKVVSEDKHAT